MSGIYLHIPFCRQACHYCDFHFSTDLSIRKKMVEAIVSEIELQKDYLGQKEIQTIYVGGGTPSLLLSDESDKIVNAIYKHFSVSASAEFTMEVNPDDVTLSILSHWKKIGVNRLSVGIQSFDDQLLKFLNRIHDAAHAKQSFLNAREVGFNNISVDLIYAIPGLSPLTWLNTIKQTLALQPEHLSAYSLTVEERTVFGRRAAKKKFTPVPDDVSAEHLLTLVAQVIPNGLQQYEISNFARPGFISRHNSSYWKQDHYLGIGPGAHSFNGTSRQANVSNNNQYISSIEKRAIPALADKLSREDNINEFVMTSLRTTAGCDLQHLLVAYSHDLIKENEEYICQLQETQLAIVNGDNLRLTLKGLLLADRIASDLFIMAEPPDHPN